MSSKLLPLKSRLDEFLRALRKAPRTQSCAFSLVRREVDSLRQDYALKTLPAYFTQYRKAIAARLGRKHPAIDMFLSQPAARRVGLPLQFCCGLASTEIGAAKRAVRRRVIANQHAQIPVDHPELLVSIALHLVTSPSVFTRGPLKGKPCWPEILVGLVLLTGRRPVELALLGDLHACRPSTKDPARRFRLVFDGQAKTRGAFGTRQGPYPIQTLAPARQVLRAFRLLRSSTPEFRDATHFNNVAAKQMFEVMTLHFDSNTTGLRLAAYDLRALSGRLTYHLFAPPQCTDLAWFQDQFGHSDTITSAFYQRYYLPKPAAWRRTFGSKFPR